MHPPVYKISHKKIQKMISPQTIQQVKDRVDILDILHDYIKLKKQGANYLGICPFHAEKSPSFTVSPAKQIYKCFGCGKTGGAINFIMEHDKKTYPQTIEILATRYNIAIQIEEETPEKKEAREKAQSQKDWYHEILQYTVTKYHQNLITNIQAPAYQYLKEKRQFTEETIHFWQLGAAPEAWQYLTDDIIKKEWYQPAKDLGLVSEKEGKVFDFFRNRIIIPIHDHHGNIAGITAREIPISQQSTVDSQQPSVDSRPSSVVKTPKYLNSKESLIFNKSKILFGLHQAIQARAFKPPFAHNEEPYCYLVEGNADVITLHECGFQNAVATCGTSLTEHHIRLLKQHVNYVVIIPDTDASGHTAAQKNVDHLLSADMRVEVLTLPTAKDIDEYIRQYASSP
jgi:DNA primase